MAAVDMCPAGLTRLGGNTLKVCSCRALSEFHTHIKMALMHEESKTSIVFPLFTMVLIIVSVMGWQ